MNNPKFDKLSGKQDDMNKNKNNQADANKNRQGNVNSNNMPGGRDRDRQQTPAGSQHDPIQRDKNRDDHR